MHQYGSNLDKEHHHHSLGHIETYRAVPETDVAYRGKHGEVSVLFCNDGTIVTQNSRARYYENRDLEPFFEELRFKDGLPVRASSFPDKRFIAEAVEVYSGVICHDGEDRIEFRSSSNYKNPGEVWACGGGITKEAFSSRYEEELTAISHVLDSAPEQLQKLSRAGVEALIQNLKTVPGVSHEVR